MMPKLYVNNKETHGISLVNRLHERITVEIKLYNGPNIHFAKINNILYDNSILSISQYAHIPYQNIYTPGSPVIQHVQSGPIETYITLSFVLDETKSLETIELLTDKNLRVLVRKGRVLVVDGPVACKTGQYVNDNLLNIEDTNYLDILNVTEILLKESL